MNRQNNRITPANSYPRLIADIGGTNARFSLETRPFHYEQTKTVECKNYLTLAQCVLEYIAHVNMQIHHIALSLPGQIIDDTLFMINNPWHGQSIQKTRQKTGMNNFIVLNDWHALALSIPYIPRNHLTQVGGTDEPDMNKPIIVIGPGTGLGMATLIKHPIEGFFAIASEGARSSFSPVNQEEIELWQFIHNRFNHVSVERFLSGPGLQLIYEALCSQQCIPITRLPTPAAITEMGITGTNLLCKRTLDIFCRILGTVASNLAVIVNAFGGVYIGGGIVPKILNYFTTSGFRCRFEDKGRFRPLLEKIPVYVIIEEFPAFLGASYALETYLTKGYIP